MDINNMSIKIFYDITKTSYLQAICSGEYRFQNMYTYTVIRSLANYTSKVQFLFGEQGSICLSECQGRSFQAA